VSVRLRHVAAINPSTPEFELVPDTAELPFLPLEAVWPGDRLDTTRRQPKAAVSSGYTRFREGDILLPKITPTFQADRTVIAIGLEGGVGAGTTELHVVRAGSDADVRYLCYLLSSKKFLDEGEASMIGVAGQKRVPDDCLRDLPVPVVDLRRQRAIADYLDRETARIDALIAKKRRMIELLEEQTHAWSVRLVLGDLGGTKGSTSPSGLYRVVPDGWKETALRHLHCSVQTGPFGSQLHAEEYVEGGWPVVNPMNLVEGEISAVETMTVSDQKRTELARHILAPGDIVFGRRGQMGRAGLAEEAHRGWLCGTGSLRLRLRTTLITPTYLKLLLETPVARAYFELASVGSTMDNLNSEIVLALPTLVPPIATQDRIVEDVHARRETTEALRGRLERQIGLLQEHRQALITAAVTGELEIPGVAA